jgi:hypothetical protein
MIVIWNADSPYVLPIYGQSMIICDIANLPAGVSMIGWIVLYVWMTLMRAGCCTARKSLSLIFIEDSYHWVTLLGVIKSHLWKARQLEKGHKSEKLEQISHKCSMILRSQKMVSLKVTVRITTGLINIIFGSSLMQRHCYYPTTSILCTTSMCLDVTGFSKDNMNARKDLAALYDRPLLEVKKMQREICLDHGLHTVWSRQKEKRYSSGLRNWSFQTAMQLT